MNPQSAGVPSSDPRDRVVTRIARHPSAVLLAAQLLIVVAYPFLDGSRVGRGALGVIQMIVVMVATWAVRKTSALTWVAVLLGVPAMAMTVVEALQPDEHWVVLTSACFHTPFYFFVSYSMIRYLFHDDRVTSDELYATGAAFTVVAWGFAYMYAAVNVLWPGSYPGISDQPGQVWFQLLFLSFTTLTSTGLSDVTPVLAHARSAMMLEQVAGVFYLALVVARLVGLVGLAGRRSDRNDGGA